MIESPETRHLCEQPYTERLSDKTFVKARSLCGEIIIKENYLGGSIYYYRIEGVLL